MIGSFLSSIGGQMCNWCYYQKSFAYLSCKTTNWSHIAVGLYSSRSQKASKCCKHISDTLSSVLWATFFVVTIFCVGASHTWQNKYNTTTSMHPDSLYSCTGQSQRMTNEDISGNNLCFFLHSLKSFAKTNLAKIAKKKNCRQHSSNTHGLGDCTQGILSAAL